MSVSFRFQVAAIVAGCLLASPLSARAATIQLEFSALGFTSAPQDPVSGTLVYEAPSLTEDISSLTSISLTIDGLAYGIGEISFANLSPNSQYIGASLSGPTSVQSQTKDFRLGFDPKEEITFAVFIYSSPSAPGIWNATSVSINRSFVPEPSSAILVMLGLATLATGRPLPV
jgi:hypothetical protein